MSCRRAQHTCDTPHLHVLREVEFAPVFILGLHRSGTTLLYQLLAATQRVSFLSVYQVLNYDELLYHHLRRTEPRVREELRCLLSTLGIKTRLIDKVVVTPELPEEYGFILRRAGSRPLVYPATLPLFTELCRKVQFVAGVRRPLLLKNPGDFPNFRYLYAAFPDAKFIFIHRHPVHVINSQLRTLHALLRVKNPYVALLDAGYDRLFQRPLRLWLARLCMASRWDLGIWSVTRQSARATAYFVHHIGVLPESALISIRYEDLCQAPRSHIERILAFLGVDSTLPEAYQADIAPRPLHLLPEVVRTYPRLCQQFRSYGLTQGYTL